MSNMRKKMRLGVGDWLLIFVLLISLLSGFLRFREMRDQSVESDLSEHRVLLLTDAVHTSTADCLNVGELLYNAAGDAIGRVIQVERQALEVSVKTERGSVRGAWPIEEKCRLRVEITVLGTMRDGVLLLDGKTPLPVGAGQTLFSGRLMLSGVIVGAF